MKDTVVGYVVLDQAMRTFGVQFICDNLVKFFAEYFYRSIISVEGGPTDLYIDISYGMIQLTYNIVLGLTVAICGIKNCIKQNGLMLLSNGF